MLWDYFVDWNKVFINSKQLEVNLNTLNYLLGKKDFDDEFRWLIKNHPEVISTIPVLAVRNGSNDKKFNILVDYSNNKLVYDEYDFTNADNTDESIEKYLEYIKKTGLIKLFGDKGVKQNLVDYVLGVEAGLDSNGRKQRSGNTMEKIVEEFVKKISEKHGFTYLTQANAASIKQNFDIVVPVDKSSRRYDFAIKHGLELTLIEVNFYNGGGSKLKSTAGEYKTLQNEINRTNHNFVWITDGLGWHTAHQPLLETFNHNDYIINLSLLEQGALEEILSKD
jgi:type II restriction enzyme